jgi:meiotically up-regulated gene 157 (Mug157) protein
MEIIRTEFRDGEEYAEFVRKFATMLDKEFESLEKYSEDPKQHNKLAERMPALISLVNTVGFLRGQDNVFLGTRPRVDNQEELYGYEDYFEKKLQRLIDILMSSDAKEFYLRRLAQYFVEARGGGQT